MRVLAAFVLLCACAFCVASQPPVFEFEDSASQIRFHALLEELRCVVCQNQSLSDSNAPLAQDLRQIVYEQLMRGDSDEQIKAFLVERYGDFILYRPPVNIRTSVLWGVPLFLFVLGGLVLWRVVRRYQRVSDD